MLRSFHFSAIEHVLKCFVTLTVTKQCFSLYRSVFRNTTTIGKVSRFTGGSVSQHCVSCQQTLDRRCACLGHGAQVFRFARRGVPITPPRWTMPQVKHLSEVFRRSKIGGCWVPTQNLLQKHFLFTVEITGRLRAANVECTSRTTTST